MGKVKKKRTIKALVVKAERVVQKVGEIQIASPLGVKVNHMTGELETPVELKLIDKPVFTPTVVCDKLINQGLQKACLVVQKTGRADCVFSVSSKINLDIPIFSMHDIPDIKSGDHVQEKAEVESIDIRGIRDPNYRGCEQKDILIIRVVYKVKVIIAREEVITVPEHCEGEYDGCCIEEADAQDTIINKNNINVVVNPFKSSSKKYSW